jgi:hypothetical protein
MGKLVYGAREIDIPDRPLAHLQVVMVDKLRRGETFSLTVDSGLDGRRTLWFGPHTEVAFVFFGNRVPRLNRTWLAMLAEAAYTTAGLRLMPEPEDVPEDRAA